MTELAIEGLTTLRCLSERLGVPPRTAAKMARKAGAKVARIGTVTYVLKGDSLDMTCPDIRTLVEAIRRIEPPAFVHPKREVPEPLARLLYAALKRYGHPTAARGSLLILEKPSERALIDVVKAWSDT